MFTTRSVALILNILFCHHNNVHAQFLTTEWKQWFCDCKCSSGTLQVCTQQLLSLSQSVYSSFITY